MLFSVIKDKDDKGKVLDVILPVTELDRANAIFERILYTLPPEPERKPAKELQQGREVFQPERQAPEKERQPQEKAKQAQPRERQAPKKEKAVSGPVKGRQGQVKFQPEVPQRPTEQGRQEAPVSRSQEDMSSPVIKCKKTPRKKCSFVAEVKGKR